MHEWEERQIVHCEHCVASIFALPQYHQGAALAAYGETYYSYSWSAMYCNECYIIAIVGLQCTAMNVIY